MLPEENIVAEPPPLPVLPPASPGFWGAVGILALYIGCQGLCVVPFAIADFIWKTSLVRNPGVLAVVVFGAGAMTIGFAMWRWKIPFSRFTRRGNFSFTMLPWVGACCFGNILLVVTLAAMAMRWIPGAEKWTTRLKDLVNPAASPLSTFVLLVIAAPLVEETIFRGIMLQGFLLRYGRTAAIAISAVLFAVAHANPVQFFTVIGIGFLFGWWYSETQSIWLGVTGHAINNGIAFLALMSASGRTVKAAPVPTVSVILFLLALGAISLIAGVLGFRQRFLSLRESEQVI
jgi:membrane protease YdiL (CAAX protease family)